MMKKRSKRVRRRHCCKSVCKHSIKVTSFLVLPLMLTIFTIIITFEQRQDTAEQRQQDLNISSMVRD